MEVAGGGGGGRGRRTGHHGGNRGMRSKKHAENFVTEKIYRDELLELLLLT